MQVLFETGMQQLAQKNTMKLTNDNANTRMGGFSITDPAYLEDQTVTALDDC